MEKEKFEIQNKFKVRKFQYNEEARMEKWLNTLGDRKRWFKTRVVTYGSTVIIFASWAEFVDPVVEPNKL